MPLVASALLAQEVSFFDHNPTGALVSVLSTDVEALSKAGTNELASPFSSVSR